MSNIEYFTCEIRHETTNAYLLHDGDREIWMPKSQISDEKISFDGRTEWLEFGIPEWLAIEKEMV